MENHCYVASKKFFFNSEEKKIFCIPPFIIILPNITQGIKNSEVCIDFQTNMSIQHKIIIDNNLSVSTTNSSYRMTMVVGRRIDGHPNAVLYSAYCLIPFRFQVRIYKLSSCSCLYSEIKKMKKLVVPFPQKIVVLGNTPCSQVSAAGFIPSSSDKSQVYVERL